MIALSVEMRAPGMNARPKLAALTVAALFATVVAVFSGAPGAGAREASHGGRSAHDRIVAFWTLYGASSWPSASHTRRVAGYSE